MHDAARAAVSFVDDDARAAVSVDLKETHGIKWGSKNIHTTLDPLRLFFVAGFEIYLRG